MIREFLWKYFEPELRKVLYNHDHITACQIHKVLSDSLTETMTTLVNTKISNLENQISRELENLRSNLQERINSEINELRAELEPQIQSIEEYSANNDQKIKELRTELEPKIKSIEDWSWTIIKTVFSNKTDQTLNDSNENQISRELENLRSNLQERINSEINELRAELEPQIQSIEESLNQYLEESLNADKNQSQEFLRINDEIKKLESVITATREFALAISKGITNAANSFIITHAATQNEFDLDLKLDK